MVKAAIILACVVGCGLAPSVAVAEAAMDVARPDAVDAQARIQELERQMQQMTGQLKAVLQQFIPTAQTHGR